MQYCTEKGWYKGIIWVRVIDGVELLREGFIFVLDIIPRVCHCVHVKLGNKMR